MGVSDWVACERRRHVNDADDAIGRPPGSSHLDITAAYLSIENAEYRSTAAHRTASNGPIDRICH